MPFILFISFLVFLRIEELILSKRNEMWLLENGAVEYGRKHYPFIVTLHVLFFLSLIFEYVAQQHHFFSIFLLLFYFLLLTFRSKNNLCPSLLNIPRCWLRLFLISPGPIFQEREKRPCGFCRDYCTIEDNADILLNPLSSHPDNSVQCRQIPLWHTFCKV